MAFTFEEHYEYLKFMLRHQLVDRNNHDGDDDFWNAFHIFREEHADDPWVEQMLQPSWNDWDQHEVGNVWQWPEEEDDDNEYHSLPEDDEGFVDHNIWSEAANDPTDYSRQNGDFSKFYRIVDLFKFGRVSGSLSASGRG